MDDKTVEHLKSRLSYCKNSGCFFWKNGVNKGKKAGFRITYPKGGEYWAIKVSGKIYLAHRLALSFCDHLLKETEIVDHKNGRSS